MNDILQTAKTHLKEKIYPFWENLIDKKNGGFYGYVDFDLNIDKFSEKGCILNSRILWFFSNAYTVDGYKDALPYAEAAYIFLKDYCFDKEFGGIFWSMNFDGTIKDDTKHTYNIAFAIYALSSFYEASKNKEALELALELFSTIENICKDKIGYNESFKRDFTLSTNEKLSDNEKVSETGIVATKTMNTILHVMEAFTELFRVSKLDNVKKSLLEIVLLVEEKIFNKNENRLDVYFDDNYNSLIDTHSYGHDIEAAWLIDRAVEILDDDKLKERTFAYTKLISRKIADVAFDKNVLLNERVLDTIDKRRVWWVQAEAVVGFFNAYQKSGNKDYMDISNKIFDYIMNNLVDKRENGEWFWQLDENNIASQQPIVEPWKCPYHNGRMCFEIIRRNENV